jgi:DNA (cytosine-5)-methyltransferase 1
MTIVGCVEVDADCRATLERNRPEWPLLQPGDVHAHRPSDLVHACRLRGEDPVLLAGGPPCQPFSKAAQWRNGTTARMQDARAATLRAFLDICAAATPDAMLLENVGGIITARRKHTGRVEALDLIRSRLASINRRCGTQYRLQILRVDAADYGVPQHRRRAFLFAARDGTELQVPAPTHSPRESDAVGRPRARYASAWDAIGDLDDPDFDPELLPGGMWAELLPAIPEGWNYLYHTSRGPGEPLFGWRRRYWSFLLKLAKSRPSWTLQAQAGPATGPFHWRSRRLSTEELSRLQCFPRDWRFGGSPSSVRRQVGNAVPAPIGEMLGAAIREQVVRDAVELPPTPLVPSPRDDCPEPEAVLRVPERYLARRGLETDHPGEGRGPGARARAAPPP